MEEYVNFALSRIFRLCRMKQLTLELEVWSRIASLLLLRLTHPPAHSTRVRQAIAMVAQAVVATCSLDRIGNAFPALKDVVLAYDFVAGEIDSDIGLALGQELRIQVHEGGEQMRG